MNKTTEFDETFDNEQIVRVRVNHTPNEDYPLKVQFVSEFDEVQHTEEFDLPAFNTFLKILNQAKRTLKEG